MKRFSYVDWTFSNTAEAATGLLLAVACALVVFV
jgi:hypothetical protein